MNIKKRISELLKEFEKVDARKFTYEDVKKHCEQYMSLHNCKTVIECMDELKNKVHGVELMDGIVDAFNSKVPCIVCNDGYISDGMCDNPKCKLNNN